MTSALSLGPAKENGDTRRGKRAGKEAAGALVIPVFVPAGPALGCAQFPSIHIHWVSALGQAKCAWP